MAQDRFGRSRLYFPIAYVAFFFGVCVLMRQIGGYDLRILTESIAASYLVLLTTWMWLGDADRSKRILVALIGVVSVFASCRLSLGDEFPRWMECAIWYLPVTSLTAGGLFCAGARLVQIHSQNHSKPTFSIGALFALTASVACCFSLVRFLAWARLTPQLALHAWLLDAITLAIPVAAVGTGMFVTVLSSRWLLAAAILVASPFAGILVGYVYGWNLPDTLIRLTTIVAVTSGLIALERRLSGYQVIRSPNAPPPAPHQNAAAT